MVDVTLSHCDFSSAVLTLPSVTFVDNLTKLIRGVLRFSAVVPLTHGLYCGRAIALRIFFLPEPQEPRQRSPWEEGDLPLPYTPEASALVTPPTRATPQVACQSPLHPGTRAFGRKGVSVCWIHLPQLLRLSTVRSAAPLRLAASLGLTALHVCSPLYRNSRCLSASVRRTPRRYLSISLNFFGSPFQRIHGLVPGNLSNGS